MLLFVSSVVYNIKGYDMKKKLLLLTLLLLFFGVSCSQSQDITLNNDGSGSLKASITIHSVLIDYLKDFSEGLGYQELEGDILDPMTLKLSLEPHGFILYEYDHPSETQWNMGVLFERLNLEPFLTHTVNTSAVHTVTLKYSYEIFQQLKGSFGPELEEFFDLFGPGEEYVSEEEYAEFLAFAFEEYIDNAEAFVAALLLQEFAIRINVDGEVLSVKGGSILPNGQIEFSFPMISFASGDLDKELSFSWK